jgi:hypothetical protein
MMTVKIQPHAYIDLPERSSACNPLMDVVTTLVIFRRPSLVNDVPVLQNKEGNGVGRGWY